MHFMLSHSHDKLQIVLLGTQFECPSRNIKALSELRKTTTDVPQNSTNYHDNEIEPFPSDAIQNLRLAVLAPVACRPRIQQALQSVNFRYHRTCSYSDIIRECNVGEGETLLMFWGCERTDSKITMSMSASSCSSEHTLACNQRDKEWRSIAQQTDISCRYTPGIASPVNVTEGESQRVMRARIADSLTFSSPTSSLLQPAGRSMSILGSVCALLLNKQGSGGEAKEGASVGGVGGSSDTICRICFGGASAERLERPCACRGTVAAVHRSCLERWLLQAATSSCELCRHHYVVTRTHKWSWVRSLAQWALSGGRGRALVADAWRGAALGAASVLGTARALHACDLALQAGARRGGGAALAANLFSSLLIGIIGALNGLLTTWMLLKIQEHQASWQAWRDSTLHVHVSLGGSDAVLAGGGAGGELSAHGSDETVVARDGRATADRSTNVADPFMVALPYTLSDS